METETLVPTKRPVRRTLMAVARPQHGLVIVMGRTYPYTRMRRKQLTDDQCFYQIMKQAAKMVLRQTAYYSKILKQQHEGVT